jgi:hypothetical protein
MKLVEAHATELAKLC